MILFGKVEIITSKVLLSPPWLGLPLWNICVTNNGYVPLVNASRSFPHSWLVTGFVTRLIQRVSLVEHTLLTLQEHLSSYPDFSGVVLLFSFLCMFCRSLFVLLSFYFWSLCFLFLYLRILIIPLVSSNSSYSNLTKIISNTWMLLESKNRLKRGRRRI